ncbi:hypothetical protein [Roseomonas sp. BN140053]|uniref:hypothetical protein n=1 Tax=Roseomonas sp. BN140053 TaxID=3391898 RepID=UPI0039E7ED3E
MAVAPAPRRSRRLADKLLLAFHHACDQNELSLAWRLLALVEVAHERAAGSDLGERRRNIGPLVAAHERLWALRHASDPAGEAGKQPPPLP